MAVAGEDVTGEVPLQNEGVFKGVNFAIIPSTGLREEAADEVRINVFAWLLCCRY